jgi:hypothetical protein
MTARLSDWPGFGETSPVQCARWCPPGGGPRLVLVRSPSGRGEADGSTSAAFGELFEFLNRGSAASASAVLCRRVRATFAAAAFRRGVTSGSTTGGCQRRPKIDSEPVEF